MPGKIAELTFLAISSLFVRIMPPRGPRSVLCVVVVATSAWGKGEGCWPPATRPAKCAMSTIRSAPTESAISRNFAKSMTRGTAEPPATISFGWCSFASAATSS